MSADSGINTFRGNSSGFWSGITGTMALAYFGTPVGWNKTPGTAFSAYLKRFYRPIMEAEPNPGHYALSELNTYLTEQNDTPFDVITMNVDGFHQRAGHAAEKVHEVHGTVLTYRCIKNGHEMQIEAELASFMETKKIPKVKCEVCGSGPRPNCVLFTEGLPQDIWNNAESAVSEMTKNSVMLVIGTSNKVYPAAGLPELAHKKGASVFQFDVKNQVVPWQQIIGKTGEVLPSLLEEIKNLIENNK